MSYVQDRFSQYLAMREIAVTWILAVVAGIVGIISLLVALGFWQAQLGDTHDRLSIATVLGALAYVPVESPPRRRSSRQTRDLG